MFINRKNDDFINEITKKYINDMRNADPKKDEVLWGGEIEINALANLFGCQIELYKDRVVDSKPNKFGKEGDAKIKLVFCNGNHYKFVKPETENEIIDVDPDGNCLFYAFLGATNQEQSIAEAGELRDAVADYISNDADLREGISNIFNLVISLAYNDDLFNDALANIPSHALREEVKDFIMPKRAKPVENKIKTSIDDADASNINTGVELFLGANNDEVCTYAEVCANKVEDLLDDGESNIQTDVKVKTEDSCDDSNEWESLRKQL